MKQTVFEVTQTFRSPDEAARRAEIQRIIDQYLKQRLAREQDA